ncbi:MFS transporter [Kerstersia gyiorum]|uniref:MFS transporter n=1 Tax=Kerstersia gyiorum TaxID=206506 RepID=UPI003B42C867
MNKTRIFGLQLLFGWLNLALTVPSIYLMFGMPLVMRQHGWSGTEIGLFQLAALPAIFKFLFAVPVQRVRLGHGHFVNWLLGLCLVVLVLYWQIGRQNLISQPLWLFGLTFAISIATTWADIPLNALAVQCLPRGEQLRAGSIRSAALFLGAIIGGGIMILVQAHHGWQMPFWLMGAALALGCLPFLWLRGQAGLPLPSAASARQDEAPLEGFVADWIGFFSQAGARQWTWLLLMGFPFLGAAWLYLKPLMLDQGMPLEQVAFIIGIVGGLTGAVFSLLGGRLAMWLGAGRAVFCYLLAALVALLLLTAIIGLHLGGVWLIGSALLLAAAMGAVSALMFGLTLFFTRRQRNASDYGLQSSLFTVTRLAVPVAAGWLLDHLGQTGMLACLACGVLCACVLAWRARAKVEVAARRVLASDARA